MNRADVLVVGAGPAGLAAAARLAEAGLAVQVVDEQPAAGGQIWRRPPEGLPEARPRRDPLRARLLAAARSAPGTTWRYSTLAWGVFDDADGGSGEHVVGVHDSAGTAEIRAPALVVTSGAYDLPAALPGWTLPGVMSAGGVQTLAKAGRLVPEGRIVLAGAHPLLPVVAAQLVAAGAEVVEVAMAGPRPGVGAALLAAPGAVWGAAKLAEGARALAALHRAGVPVRWSTLPRAILGTDAVEGVELADVDADWRPVGGVRTVDCDAVALCFGFLASAELARQAGCAVRWAPAEGGWVVEHDRWQESSVPGIFVAGEITGVAGAERAAAEGLLAALGVLRRLGVPVDRAEERRARRDLARAGRFAAVVSRQFAPRLDALTRLADDDTLVCRCEEVTAGQVRRTLAEHPYVTTVNAAKLLTRCGMGPCQGRYCGVTLAHLVAEHTGRPVEETGVFTARVPVKPLSVGELGGSPTPFTDVHDREHGTSVKY
ncbi:FAD-dependent oxidoreductase [Sphaerimonospora mesophila]|uniref:FAD-dependent oxidoreductase n=1 Tax=Sphaerimonospora mesophila TaxID=37483 RepID=UPI0007C676A0